jgi:hypothetical protein
MVGAGVTEAKPKSPRGSVRCSISLQLPLTHGWSGYASGMVARVTPTGVGAAILALVSLLEIPGWAKWVAGVTALCLFVYWLWLVLSPHLGFRLPVYPRSALPLTLRSLRESRQLGR